MGLRRHRLSSRLRALTMPGSVSLATGRRCAAAAYHRLQRGGCATGALLLLLDLAPRSSIPPLRAATLIVLRPIRSRRAIRQARPVNLADHGVARDAAKLLGDLAGALALGPHQPGASTRSVQDIDWLSTGFDSNRMSPAAALVRPPRAYSGRKPSRRYRGDRGKPATGRARCAQRRPTMQDPHSCHCAMQRAILSTSLMESSCPAPFDATGPVAILLTTLAFLPQVIRTGAAARRPGSISRMLAALDRSGALAGLWPRHRAAAVILANRRRLPWSATLHSAEAARAGRRS